jgi:hypothetical protein
MRHDAKREKDFGIYEIGALLVWAIAVVVYFVGV